MTSEVTKCDSNAEKSSVAVVNDSLETILLGRRTHTCSIASGPSELGAGGRLQEIEPKPSLSKVLGLLLVPSAAKPDPFLLVEPNYGPKMWVGLVRIGPQD